MSRSLLVRSGAVLAACALVACRDSSLLVGPASPFAKTPTAQATGGGGGGGARLEMSTPQGLYIDPSPVGDVASGHGKTVRGYVVVTYSHPSGGSTSFGTPSSTTVTLNGVALVPMPNTSGSTFWLDPAGPQPAVQPDQPLTLVANVPASPGIAPATRTLSLNCPSDISVTPTPAIGSSLAAISTVHVTSTANLVFNPNPVPSSLLSQYPNAVLYGYDTVTVAFSTQSAETILNFPFATSGFDFTLPVGALTSGNGYLMELSWPGTYLLDGNSGGFCGMTKHWTYAP